MQQSVSYLGLKRCFEFQRGERLQRCILRFNLKRFKKVDLERRHKLAARTIQQRHNHCHHCIIISSITTGWVMLWLHVKWKYFKIISASVWNNSISGRGNLPEIISKLDSLRWFSQHRSPTPHFWWCAPMGLRLSNSNSAEIFVQCTYLQVSSSYV